MRDHYDFSNGIKNPYAARLKKQTTSQVDTNITISEQEKNLFLNSLYKKLEEAEKDLREGRCTSVEEAINDIRKKYEI